MHNLYNHIITNVLLNRKSVVIGKLTFSIIMLFNWKNTLVETHKD